MFHVLVSSEAYYRRITSKSYLSKEVQVTLVSYIPKLISTADPLAGS